LQHYVHQCGEISLTLPTLSFNGARRGDTLSPQKLRGFPVVFDQNTLVGEWRAQVLFCEERDVALHRDVAFALAVANLLQLPDDLPLMPAIAAVMSVPTCLRDPASLAHLKAVALSAVRPGLVGESKAHRIGFFAPSML
jgi:hypothetical protein